MPKILEDVYKPLKLSYDFLGNQHAKSIFLLCCLFPEDNNIPLEYLTICAMGLCMFERIRNLEQVRNRTYSLVEMLKSRFSLLEGWDQNYVRMHDVVRDVAIFIASEERCIQGRDCTWISAYLGEGIELFSESIFPNLRLLMVDKLGDKELQINDSFFEGMTELNVLSVGFHSLRSLPHSTRLLKNLRTLTLYSCEALETISVVAELVNLEILICCLCGSIKELPVEIGRLVRMRLLKLSYCKELKTIAPGIISRLVGLEKLKIVKSFKKWEAEDNEGRERKNAALRELESLSNLTYLKIEVEDFALAAEQIRLSSNIVKFDITICGCQYCNKHMSPRGSTNEMHLHLPREITLGNWILRFGNNVEHMTLVGEGLRSLESAQAFQNLRSLTLREYSKVKNLGNIVSPLLEYLDLDNLPNLEEICVIDGPTSDDEGCTSNIAFKNLKELRLSRLPALKHLCKNNIEQAFPNLRSLTLREYSKVKNLGNIVCPLLEYLDLDNLPNLEEIYVIDGPISDDEGCTSNIAFKNLKELRLSGLPALKHLCKNNIGAKSGRGRYTRIFPKLEKLTLWHLPRLTTFCEGVESIKFPFLTKMKIWGCPKLMKSHVSTTCSIGCGNNTKNSESNNHDHDDDVDSLHLFCKPKEVAFDRVRWLLVSISTVTLWCHRIPISLYTGLEDLNISDCNKIKCLFSYSIAENLVNLKELRILGCSEMVKVIDDKEAKDACIFPSLQFLQLENLDKLEMFCGWRSCALELPSLKTVEILRCQKMERFSFASLTTPNLEKIRRRSWSIISPLENLTLPEIIINAKDLNDGVQQLLFKAKEGEERWRKMTEQMNKRAQEKAKERGETEEEEV